MTKARPIEALTIFVETKPRRDTAWYLVRDGTLVPYIGIMVNRVRDQSINQSINQSISQSVSQSVSQVEIKAPYMKTNTARAPHTGE